jgi:cyanophycin synthetase
LERAIQTALLHSDQAMIQKHVVGRDYRVLVIAGKMIGVLEYEPAFLVGDGRSTIEQLIHRLNADQLRRTDAGDAGSFQEISADCEPVLSHLEQQGLTVQAILENGARLELFGSANVLADGISEIVTDRTEQISPANATIAVEAAQALQVDVAGIDIRCKDIRLPLDEENGGILEVNALPDMVDPHLFLQGASTDVFKEYLRYLFEE